MNKHAIYLNHAGTSWPKPSVVGEAVQDAMDASPAQWPRRFDEAHQAIAEYFGVDRPEQILLTPGCTSALAVGIGDTAIGSGTRVLTTRWEHHALHRPLLKLTSTGVRVDYIPSNVREQPDGPGGGIDLDWLEKELAKRDVEFVAMTAACNVTGELFPYQEVIRLAKQYDSMVLIDAAQIVGWQRLDLARLGADIVAFGGHKGLQAPWGIGGLYLSDRARMQCVSARCDLPSQDKSVAEHSPRPGYCDVGSVDQFALAGLHAAIEMLSRQDADISLANGRKQIERIRAGLESMDRVRFFGPTEPSQRMPTLALKVSASSSAQIASRLKQHGLIVGSGIQCAPLAHQSLETQDHGLVRLSVGLGQADEEIDAAINRLRLTLGERSTGRSQDGSAVGEEL